MRDWPLQRRLAATLAAVAVLTLACVGVAAVLFEAVRDQQHEVVDNYFEAVTDSDRQLVPVIQLQARIRNAAVSGDAAAVREVGSTLPGAETDERLRDLLAADQLASRALTARTDAAEAWWTGWAVPTVSVLREGDGTALPDADVIAGDRLFDRLHEAHDDYVDTLGQQRQREVAELDARNRSVFAAVVAVAVVAVLAIALIGYLLRRWVTGPLLRLAGETRIVRAGALDHRVEVDGPPEISRLSKDVDEMRRRLVEEIATVRQATVSLAAARDELEQQSADLSRSNRELEQFAYVASHDLQEPLRKVASFCQLLEKRYGGQLDDRGEQYIHFAVDGAKRMQQLINDLLDFSRVGRVTTEQTEVALGACLDRALGNLSAALEESGAVVTRDELPVVRGEAPLLTQVFQNLVGNAVKFRGDEPPRLHVGVRRDGDSWEVSCADNGIGIEPQYHDRVFVIFQRLHPKDVYSGTGIGLSMCKKIIEYHGGRIWVDDTVERGTTIRFALPASEPEAPAGAGAPEADRAGTAVGSVRGADGTNGSVRQDDGATGGAGPVAARTSSDD